MPAWRRNNALLVDSNYTRFVLIKVVKALTVQFAVLAGHKTPRSAPPRHIITHTLLVLKVVLIAQHSVHVEE